jgi:predicted hydrocarbon binding protein
MSTFRFQLGDFSSIICLKAMIIGMEDALGAKATAIALTTAGRKRGKDLVKSLNLSGSKGSLEDISSELRAALGEGGTRLCIINKIESTDEVFKAYITEDICTSGEPDGSDRKCLFTLGAVWGALEEITGKRLQGKHTDSVLKGSQYNVFEFIALA